MYILLLAGCLIEQDFGQISLDDPTDGTDGADDTGGTEAPSPWDHLDAGSLPDVAFLVFWHDVTGLSALDEANDAYPCRPGPTLWAEVHGDPSLDLVDLRGQVLGHVEIPASLDPYDTPMLQALGPTEALLVGRLDFGRRRAWDIDAAAPEARELAAWEIGEGVQNFTARGVSRAISPGFSNLHPTRIGETLYVAGEVAVGPEAPPLDQPVLYAFDLADAEAAPRVWTVADLLPPALVDADAPPQLLITHLQPAHGELVMQISFFGPAWDGTDPAAAWRHVRFVFLPETSGRSWTIDVSDDALDAWSAPVHRHTDTGRAALFTQYAYEIPDPALVLYDAAKPPATITPKDSTCLAGLALLDATAPTVLYTHHDPNGPDDYGNNVVVNHEGRDVWELDHLKVGLGARRAQVRALVALD